MIYSLPFIYTCYFETLLYNNFVCELCVCENLELDYCYEFTVLDGDQINAWTNLNKSKLGTNFMKTYHTAKKRHCIRHTMLTVSFDLNLM